jgi:hypothetical protein
MSRPLGYAAQEPISGAKEVRTPREPSLRDTEEMTNPRTVRLTPQDLFVWRTGDATPTMGLRDRRLTLQWVADTVDQDSGGIAGNVIAAYTGDPRKVLLDVADAIGDLARQPTHQLVFR